ncbi:nose resistant to fluoxetine protein 6 [Dendroctonus ponderosae]|uniref:nose resistant to fluoxetine protein 6 n=1 Tax=Dendroctonus ponderosae TaxID=77166 RepID=UPI0020353D4F|nr:nose resistant to fluoxetine protein 6 [Dendroctonus ponderosae]XP_019759044.2 nose resistant to fluoxetine protein 6 [Dendroctonus ponderosae]
MSILCNYYVAVQICGDFSDRQIDSFVDVHSVLTTRMAQFLQRFLLLVLLVELGDASCLPDNVFPPMYRMDHYKNCPRNTSTYCLFTFKVHTKMPQILETENNPQRFDRSILNRMLCVPNSIDTIEYGNAVIAGELHGFNFTVQLDEVQCEQQWEFPYQKTIIWLIIATYLLITLEATRAHYRSLRDPKASSHWCHNFSVIRNAQKLFEQNRSPDFQRLKSVQGIRVFNMGVVVAWHCAVSLSQTYMTDVEQLEKNFEHPLVHYLMYLGGLCVQMFFLISSFLLTNQILQMFSRNGRFSLQDCCIMMLNRVVRLMPVLLFSIFTTWMGIYDNSPHTIANRNVYIPSCGCNWWRTLLQTTFLIPFSQICTPGMWYLSVDTLYYGSTLLILYLALNLHLDLRRLSARLILILIGCFAVYLQVKDYSYMFRPHPQELKTMTFSKDMNGVYVPPLASWPSSLFGVILGHIYYSNKLEKSVKVNPDQEKMWWMVFGCVPLLSLHLSTYSFTGVAGSILGAILKPLFVFPLGLGVLGMAFGLGGPVKALLEARVLVVLSNVTFCTYVFHFYVVFAKGFFLDELLPYHAQDLVSWLTFDLLAAFGLGTVMTILVEFPCLALQKLCLPQVKPAAKKLE